MRFDLRRIRPPEILALLAGVLLAVALFLPWYDFPGGREDAWHALTVAEVPAALAALVALALVAVTPVARSSAQPVALAIWTTALGLVSVVVVTVRVVALPGMALGRCYGLWLALAGAIGVLVAGWLSLRDERPSWGVRASGAPQ
ncbi:MAG: hypothetical protein ABSG64_04865 [Solirubrobacteraceae bacterium]